MCFNHTCHINCHLVETRNTCFPTNLNCCHHSFFLFSSLNVGMLNSLKTQKGTTCFLSGSLHKHFTFSNQFILAKLTIFVFFFNVIHLWMFEFDLNWQEGLYFFEVFTFRHFNSFLLCYLNTLTYNMII